MTEVVLNETRTAHVLVDTGATFCIISPELAEELGIDPGRQPKIVQLQTGSGTTSGSLVTLASLRAGDAEAANVQAVIHAAPPGMDGILGNSFLARFTVTLDAERGILTLRPPR